MDDRDDEREARREGRVTEQRAAGGAPARRSRLLIGAGLAVAAAVVVLIVLLSGGGGSGGGPPPTTTTGTPILLGSTQGEAVGRTVDGIECQREEQVLFHIHAHLAVFVGDQPATIPEGIGIAPPRSVEQSTDGPFVLGGACFYWLHSHTADGVIHIESPLQRTFTLGDYFDLWNQPLSSSRVAGAGGRVIAYLDGRPFAGDPRTIPLGAHAVIQLDVAGSVPPVPYAFPTGL